MNQNTSRREREKYLTPSLNEDFEKIAIALETKGYIALENFLPLDISNALYHQAVNSKESFSKGNILLGVESSRIEDIRRDTTYLIDGKTQAEIKWFEWTEKLRVYLNEYLNLGLNFFESHLSHHIPGSFYHKHLDGLCSSDDRVVSIISYLNPVWEQSYGGQLVIDDEKNLDQAVCISPKMGTVVVFLSREFPHAVLPTWRDRYSVVGWYQANTLSVIPSVSAIRPTDGIRTMLL